MSGSLDRLTGPQWQADHERRLRALERPTRVSQGQPLPKLGSFDGIRNLTIPTQSVPNATHQILTLDRDFTSQDGDAYFDYAESGFTQVTLVGVSAVIEIMLHGYVGPDTGGTERGLAIRLNGGVDGHSVGPVVIGAQIEMTPRLYWMNPGDILEVEAFQNSGVSGLANGVLGLVWKGPKT